MRMVTRSLVFVFVVATAGAGVQGGAAYIPATLDSHGRDLLLRSMRVMDGCFDERAALIRPLSRLITPEGDRSRWLLVRETSWYAAGLLLRNQPGDRERALRSIEAVLKYQIDKPGAVYHGTFYRYPEEPQPPGTRRWQDYDPNWREFIGTTFQIILVNYRDRLPQDLAKRMEQSIRLAIEGEIQEARLRPTYTNVALLFGALLDFAGQRFERPEWTQRAAEWNDAVYREFTQYGAFTEFNSPTYYGTDLFGLALWRVHGTTPRMREAGAAMEAAVWRSIASMYHAGLRNIAGPYDRAYGMDMRRYASLTGLWLRAVLDEGEAPHPPIEYDADHGSDIAYAPCFLLVPTRIPADAMKHFHAFQGERLVRQQITAKRIATAWIGKNYILGGEFTNKTWNARPGSQFHPATVHWKTPDGGVGWIRLLNTPAVDATASRDTLEVSLEGDATFRIMAPGVKTGNVERSRWRLPGLTVEVETDADGATAEPAKDYLEIVYRHATRFTLKLQSAP
jgi:hypothetical protein